MNIKCAQCFQPFTDEDLIDTMEETGDPVHAECKPPDADDLPDPTGADHCGRPCCDDIPF